MQCEMSDRVGAVQSSCVKVELQAGDGLGKTTGLFWLEVVSARERESLR